MNISTLTTTERKLITYYCCVIILLGMHYYFYGLPGIILAMMVCMLVNDTLMMWSLMHLRTESYSTFWHSINTARLINYYDPILERRDPLASDKAEQVGQRWINISTKKIFMSVQTNKENTEWVEISL